MYITEAHLTPVIPPQDYLDLTDRTNDPPTTPDAAIVAAAIGRAEGRFHAYVARRYKLPLDVTDLVLMGFITPILVDFAWEALHPRADMVPSELTDRTKLHETILKAIRDGDMDLPAASPPPLASTDDKITASDEGRQFSQLP